MKQKFTDRKLGIRLNLLALMLLCTSSGFGQIIDSVLFQPYENVDSIAFWHELEINNDKSYMIYGLIKYCNCDYHSFLQKTSYKLTDTIRTSEGFIENGVKNGEWIYWNDVARICCDEFYLYPDSTVVYDNGLRIEKTDRLGHYIYFENQTRIEITSRSYNVAVECNQDSCEIMINDKFLLKKIEKEYLGFEMKRIIAGEYDFEAQKIINDFKKYQNNNH